MAMLTWSGRAEAQAAGIAGSGLGCIYSTIQDAIDNLPAGSGVVLAAAGTGGHYINLSTGGGNVVLAPADDDCLSYDLSKTVYANAADSTGAVPHVSVAAGGTLQIYNFVMGSGNYDGVGGTISAGDGATVHLVDTVIYGTNAEYGGAIGFEDGGSLYMDGSIIENSHATEHGGAIYMGPGSTFEMSGGKIGSQGWWHAPHNVTAGREGGAIYLTSGSTADLLAGAEVIEGVAGTVVSNAGHGGCIGGLGSVYVAGGAVIRGCDAPGDGGAIRASDVWINGGPVRSSSAGKYGGAIYADEVRLSGGSVIGGTSGTGNTAGVDGGGIYAETSILAEKFTEVAYNSAGRDGGALWSPTVTIRESAVVRDATATGHGGCVYGDAVLVTNSAQVGSCIAGGAGGAIRGETITVDGSASVYDGESVLSGGLVHIVAGGTLSVSSSASLTDGETDGLGGLVSVAPEGHVLVSGSAELARGTAGLNGGLIYLAPTASGLIQGNAQLEDGAAAAHGGLIRHAGSGTLTIKDDVQLSGGTAGDDGGLLSLNPGTVTTIGSWTGQVILSDGTASGHGGAIRVLGAPAAAAELTVGGATIVRSSSAAFGGGIAAEQATVTLEGDAQIGEFDYGNVAAIAGGGIYQSGGTLTATGGHLTYPDQGFGAPTGGVRIQHNAAAALGGGVALVDEATMLGSHVVVDQNKATGAVGSGGGVALVGESSAALHITVVSGNEARRGGGAFVGGESTLMFTGEGIYEWNQCRSWDLPPNRYCAEFTGNEAKDSGTFDNDGGAVYVADAALALNTVGIQENTAGDDGTALYLAADAVADLTNALVVGSNDAVKRSVLVKSGATMDAEMSTFTGDDSTVRYEASSYGYWHGNVIWPDNGASHGTGLALAAGSGVTGDNNVGLAVNALSGSNNLGVNPQLITTARGKYRINTTSPPHEHCDDGPDHDLDGRLRPGGSRFDAGAFEIRRD